MAKLLLITGPSGAGKTTVSKSLLKQLTGEWAYISQDDLRQLVIAGYASADDYEHEWSEEVRRQWNVSIPICVDVAKRYLDVGINCIIDFYATPNEFEKWKKELKDIPYTLIVLRPDLGSTLERNRSREERAKLKDNKIRQNYKAFEEWSQTEIRVVDTSKEKVSVTVEAIEKIISLI